MKKINKIMSLFVAVVFLFNTITQDVTFAQTLQPAADHTLGIRFMSDDIVGIEKQDTDRVAGLTRLIITSAFVNAGELNRDSLIEASDRLRENTYRTQPLSRELKSLPNKKWAIRFKTREGDLTDGPNWYWAVFPMEVNDVKTVSITIYPEEEFNALKREGYFEKGQVVKGTAQVSTPLDQLIAAEDREILGNLVGKVLSMISARESKVLRLRAQGLTLREIGNRSDFNVHRERIRQLEKRAELKILKFLEQKMKFIEFFNHDLYSSVFRYLRDNPKPRHEFIRTLILSVIETGHRKTMDERVQGRNDEKMTTGDLDNTPESIREMLDGGLGTSASTILNTAGNAFPAKSAFPVKPADTKSNGVDISRQSGNLKVLAEHKASTDVDREISDMTSRADKVGRAIPIYLDTRYELIFPQEYCTNGSLDAAQAKRGDRAIFTNAKLSAISDEEEYVDYIIGRSDDGRKGRVAALVDKNTDKRLLQKLKAADVRFVLSDMKEMVRIFSARKKDERIQAFRDEVPAIMLAKRHLSEKTMYDQDGKPSDTYEVVKHYLRTHFNLDHVSAEVYINAMISSDLTPSEIQKSVEILIHGYLMYRPAKPYDTRKDYENIAVTLLSA